MSNKDIMAPKAQVIKDYVPDSARVQKIENTLIIVRMSLLIKQPFWGQLAARFILQDASGWCPTAATDGRYFYYNVDFIESLTMDELKFLFAHEIEHCAFSHFMRRDSRDPQLWNIAADFVVNADLVNGKVGSMPKVGLYDKKFDGMSSEEVYDALYKDAEKIKSTCDTLDVHLDEDDGEGDNSSDGDEGGYKPGNENKGPSISQAEMEQIQEEMKNAIVNAAKNHEQLSGAGSIPAGMQRLIKKWTKPQMDWRQFIETRYLSLLKSDYTFLNANRRGELPGGIRMPAMKNDETIKAYIAIDASGSMSNEMLKDLMGEVIGIMEQFPGFEVHIWCFDGVVIKESYKIFTEETIQDAYEYSIMGGGGTIFESNWEWMREMEMIPDTFLLFTDGYPCGSWGDPNFCDTIFLIHGSEQIEAPFGITLHYKPKNKK